MNETLEVLEQAIAEARIEGREEAAKVCDVNAWALLASSSSLETRAAAIALQEAAAQIRAVGS